MALLYPLVRLPLPRAQVGFVLILSMSCNVPLYPVYRYISHISHISHVKHVISWRHFLFFFSYWNISYLYSAHLFLYFIRQKVLAASPNCGGLFLTRTSPVGIPAVCTCTNGSPPYGTLISCTTTYMTTAVSQLYVLFYLAPPFLLYDPMFFSTWRVCLLHPISSFRVVVYVPSPGGCVDRALSFVIVCRVIVT